MGEPLNFFDSAWYRGFEIFNIMRKPCLLVGGMFMKRVWFSKTFSVVVPVKDYWFQPAESNNRMNRMVISYKINMLLDWLLSKPFFWITIIVKLKNAWLWYAWKFRTHWKEQYGCLRNLRIQGRGSAMGKDDFLRAGLKTLHFLFKL